MIHLEALCAVERDHLNGRDKIDTEGDGTTHDVIEMTVCNQRMRVGIIRNHGRKSAVYFVLRDGLGDLLQIVPSGALAQHGIHAEAHFCECVLRTGGFMTAAHAACNVCIEAATRLRDGIVTCDDFAGFQRFAGNVVRRLRGSGDAREVHHFAETNGIIVLHFRGNIRGGDLRAGILKSRNSRNAGGGRQHSLQRSLFRLFRHQVNAFEAKHIADFVRVIINPDGAMGDNGLCIFNRRHHGRLNVDMTVKETRGDKLTLGIDDLCAFTDAVCGIADKCDTAAGNCNIGVVEDFMRADVYETRIANDRLCGLSAHCNIGKRAGALPKLGLTKLEHKK